MKRRPTTDDYRFDHESAVTARPKQPLLDWVKEVAPLHPMKWTAERIMAAEEPVVWIIPSTGTFESGEDLRDYLNSLKVGIMRSELRGFSIEESLWPKVSCETFDKYFEMIVFDHVASARHIS